MDILCSPQLIVDASLWTQNYSSPDKLCLCGLLNGASCLWKINLELSKIHTHRNRKSIREKQCSTTREVCSKPWRCYIKIMSGKERKLKYCLSFWFYDVWFSSCAFERCILMASLGSIRPSILSFLLKSVESSQCESSRGKKLPKVGLEEQLNDRAVKFTSSNPNPFEGHAVWFLFVHAIHYYIFKPDFCC